MYKLLMEGSKISLATVLTVSTLGYTQSDESVEVLGKTLAPEQSTTMPYSASDESIQLLSEEEKEKENNDKEEVMEKDIKDGQESVGVSANVPVVREEAGNHEKSNVTDATEGKGKQGKDSVDGVEKETVSPVKNNVAKQGKDTVDCVEKEAVSPVKNNTAK